MTGPRPPIQDALARLRRPSAAEALATLRGSAPDFSDVTGGRRTDPGPPLSAWDVERIRERAEIGAQKAIGEELIQGATANFGDELGLVDRDANEQWRRQSPVASTLANAIGLVLNPASRLLAGKGVMGTAGRAAIHGALSGAGDAPTMADIPAEAAKRAALEGGSTLAIGGVVKGVSAARKAPAALKNFASEKAARLLARTMGLPPSAGSAVARMMRGGGSAADDVAAAASALPDEQVAAQAAPATAPHATPEVRGGFPRQRPAPAMQTSRGAAPEIVRYGPQESGMRPAIRDNATGKLYIGDTPLHSDIPVPELADKTKGFVDAGENFITSHEFKVGKAPPAKVVPAGPYQRAAPATRMQSAPQGIDRLAESLADDPAMALRQIELARSLGVAPHPGMVERLTLELAKRMRAGVGAELMQPAPRP